jgi:hypothetical protein
MTARARLPNRRGSVIVEFEHGGRCYRASGSYFADGRLGEVFLSANKPGSTEQQHADDAAVLSSLLLQHNVSVEAIKHSISGPIAMALDLLTGGEP